jgi:spore germination cell wall hydrolase CwlJ-like protein
MPQYVPDTGQVDALARTIYGEARGEGRAGMEAVASVVLNRMAQSGWAAGDVRRVVWAPGQFTVWHPRDVNFAPMMRAGPLDPEFREAMDIARRALLGLLVDRTGGADHYHATDAKRPAWASPSRLTATIGRHSFYRLAARA